MEWLYKALEAALDAIVPLRARLKRTRSRTIADFALCPTAHELLGSRIVTLLDYRDPATQDLIRTLKYDGSAYAAALAAQIIEDYLREELAAEKLFSGKRLVLVPVPLHGARRRERGFNQIEQVLLALSPESEYRKSMALGALVRTRATKPQTRFSRYERLSNVAGAF